MEFDRKALRKKDIHEDFVFFLILWYIARLKVKSEFEADVVTMLILFYHRQDERTHLALKNYKKNKKKRENKYYNHCTKCNIK